MLDSFADFVAMGGYAGYVWSSYGIALVVVLGNLIWPLVRHRQTCRRIRNGDCDD